MLEPARIASVSHPFLLGCLASLAKMPPLGECARRLGVQEVSHPPGDRCKGRFHPGRQAVVMPGWLARRKGIDLDPIGRPSLYSPRAAEAALKQKPSNALYSLRPRTAFVQQGVLATKTSGIPDDRHASRLRTAFLWLRTTLGRNRDETQGQG